MCSHSGAVGIESVPGVGSIFRVLLPTVDDTEAVGNIDVPDKRKGDWRSTGYILIVDDEPDVRAVTSRMVVRWGFSILTAENGLDGLALAEAHHASLRGVLLDMTMSQMDGRETFQRLRALMPGLPILLMSGYTEQSAADILAGQQRAGFLQKPFTPPELLARLQLLIDR